MKGLEKTASQRSERLSKPPPSATRPRLRPIRAAT